jgi:hypothetical protein
VLTIANASVFREILHTISQNSPTVNLQKTKNALVISSTSTSELCHVSVILEKPFFGKWDELVTESLEIDARTLYDVSNSIQKKSVVTIDVTEKKISFEINNLTFKRITLTDVKKIHNPLKPVNETEAETEIKVKSDTLLSALQEVGNLLDETQIILEKGTKQILFSGKRMGLSVEIRPQGEYELSVENKICIEFPIKIVRRFLPLLRNFEEFAIRFSSKTPLIIEGANEQWRLILFISMIDKNSENYN